MRRAFLVAFLFLIPFVSAELLPGMDQGAVVAELRADPLLEVVGETTQAITVEETRLADEELRLRVRLGELAFSPRTLPQGSILSLEERSLTLRDLTVTSGEVFWDEATRTIIIKGDAPTFKGRLRAEDALFLPDVAGILLRSTTEEPLTLSGTEEGIEFAEHGSLEIGRFPGIGDRLEVPLFSLSGDGAVTITRPDDRTLRLSLPAEKTIYALFSPSTWFSITNPAAYELLVDIQEPAIEVEEIKGVPYTQFIRGERRVPEEGENPVAHFDPVSRELLLIGEESETFSIVTEGYALARLDGTRLGGGELTHKGVEVVRVRIGPEGVEAEGSAPDLYTDILINDIGEGAVMSPETYSRLGVDTGRGEPIRIRSPGGGGHVPGINAFVVNPNEEIPEEQWEMVRWRQEDQGKWVDMYEAVDEDALETENRATLPLVFPEFSRAAGLQPFIRAEAVLLTGHHHLGENLLFGENSVLETETRSRFDALPYDPKVEIVVLSSCRTLLNPDYLHERMTQDDGSGVILLERERLITHNGRLFQDAELFVHALRQSFPNVRLVIGYETASPKMDSTLNWTLDFRAFERHGFKAQGEQAFKASQLVLNPKSERLQGWRAALLGLEGEWSYEIVDWIRIDTIASDENERGRLGDAYAFSERVAIGATNRLRATVRREFFEGQRLAFLYKDEGGMWAFYSLDHPEGVPLEFERSEELYRAIFSSQVIRELEYEASATAFGLIRSMEQSAH